nr:hypothetical protein [Myxococcales bacterium]
MWILLIGCSGGPTTEPVDDPEPTPPVPTSETGRPALGPGDVTVLVTLDGQPVQATVTVGGQPMAHTTDADGRLVLPLQRSGDEVVIASHDDARIRAATVSPATEQLTVALTRFDLSDNESYVFQDPGAPDDRDTTAQCAHCHVTLNEAWHASPHRTSASNEVVHDVYAGAAAAFDTEQACTEAGGQWWTGLQPGTGAAAQRCYLGHGALPDLNADCGEAAPCDGVATQTGGCADCHAPGIDGALGGRDLLEATGFAYDYGVHCDVCHKVESLDVGAEAGVAGWLRIVRPSEAPTIAGLAEQPLQFGPYDDVPHPRMGSVHRSFFHEAVLCGGCHELHQPVLVPGQTADPVRWPTGRLPIHTTFSEWLEGPISPQSPCQSCHMPPDPTVGNSSDLGNEFDVEPGLVGGWYRPPGSVRAHSWVGPRQRDSGMLELAVALDLEVEAGKSEVLARVTVSNVGAGHAIPTGEPLRSLLVLVEATCGGEALEPLSGDVLPGWAGALDERSSAVDWSVWPGASVGDQVVVVRRPGGFRDYQGPGVFGDGTFAAADKGLPLEVWAGRSTVVGVSGDAVTFDAPLPAGDVAYRVVASRLPSDGEGVSARAGAPGFAYARVLADAEGRPMAPHHRAVDVVSDNRLMPQRSATSE